MGIVDTDATILRRRFARFLAPMYVNDRVGIGRLCDKELDPTGELLGYVREEAMKFPEPHPMPKICIAGSTYLRC